MPGQRVFSVSLQGDTSGPALQNLDVVKEAGGRLRPVVREFKGVALADALTVTFTPSRGASVISGIEVLVATEE